MSERRNKEYSGSEAQNRFTAYLLVAVKNARIMYLAKKSRYQYHEIPVTADEETELFIHEPDMLASVEVLEQLEDSLLLAALSKIKERDLRILLLKAVDGITLKTIGKELRLPASTVTAVYYRALRKLREELNINGL